MSVVHVRNRSDRRRNVMRLKFETGTKYGRCLLENLLAECKLSVKAFQLDIHMQI